MPQGLYISMFYFLDDENKPVKAPPMEKMTTDEMVQWSKWFNDNTQVKSTHTSEYWVSTIFLGVCHQFSDNETPVLWETMVTKNGDFINYQRRYMSHDDAIYGHDKTVELLSNPFTKKEIDCTE